MTPIRWIGVVCFWVAATLLSGAFRPGFFDFHNAPAYPFVLRFALEALLIGGGPALAAGLCWRIFGQQNRQSSLLGGWRAGALAQAALPPAVFAAFGLPNDFGWNAHAAGAVVGLLIVLYALGEEIGWRGYMHDALGPLSFVPRGLVIGSAWWAWHLWFLQPDATVAQMLSSCGVIVGTAMIFSAIVTATRSWLATAAFHALGNIAFFAGGIPMASQQRFMIAGVAFVLMLLVHHTWVRRTSGAGSKRA
jgi:hypothetical protein